MHSVTDVDRHLIESRKNLANQGGGDKVKQSQKMLFSQFEDSLKLFISSIKFQDPMDPVDTSEMSKQMFQMSQAQGQYVMIERLDEQNSLLRAGQVLNSTSLIGKTIEVSHDQFTLSNRQDVPLSCNMPSGASSARIEILDDKDRVVFEKELSPKSGQTTVDAGRQELVWNGDVNTVHGRMINQGKPLEDGKFRIRVMAFDQAGAQLTQPGTNDPIYIPTTTKAILTGSDFSDKIPTIMVGNVRLPLSAIVSIQEQAATTNQDEINRFELVKATMEALTEDDREELLSKIKEQAKENREALKKDRKLEKKVNDLSPEQYEQLTRDIANKLDIETKGD